MNRKQRELKRKRATWHTKERRIKYPHRMILTLTPESADRIRDFANQIRDFYRSAGQHFVKGFKSV